LKDSLVAPEFLVSDFAKFDRPGHLHLGFQALSEFQKRHNSLPGAHNEEHAQEIIAISKDINTKLAKKLVEEIDEKIIRSLSYGAMGELPPIAAFLGGFAAQEVLKAVSGKFSPVKQWFYFDATEVLPKEELLVSEFQLVGSCYDVQIVVLGKTFY